MKIKNKKNRMIKIGFLISIVIIASAIIITYFSFTAKTNGDNLKNLKGKKGEDIFYVLGCVKCHNIKALNIKGGHVGPDLSNAYSNVKKIYRENVNNFLKNPSGTMYFVLMFNHLNKEDRKIIVKELKKAQSIEINHK